MPKEHFFGKINLSDTDPLRTDLLEIYSLDGNLIYRRFSATTRLLYLPPPSIDGVWQLPADSIDTRRLSPSQF